MCKGVYGLVSHSEQWGDEETAVGLVSSLAHADCCCISDSVFQVLESNAVVPLVAAGNKLLKIKTPSLGYMQF